MLGAREFCVTRRWHVPLGNVRNTELIFEVAYSLDFLDVITMMLPNVVLKQVVWIIYFMTKITTISSYHEMLATELDVYLGSTSSWNNILWQLSLFLGYTCEFPISPRRTISNSLEIYFIIKYILFTFFFNASQRIFILLSSKCEMWK